ncbi:MAG TPA: amino acid permease [Lautropia sp.]|nr:amino acid permease [Lautropia sp.]
MSSVPLSDKRPVGHAAREEGVHADSISGPHAVLGLKEAVAIIVGIVIGAGIFKAPSLVAGMVGSEGWMLAAWALGGLVSLIGALCYAELATAFPHAGGDYHFLRRAYGKRLSFLFAWARFSVITTGSIALLAFVFGDYMTQVLPLGSYSASFYAALAVLVLSWINLRGIRSGAATQTWLTLLEVAGLVLIVVAGVYAAMGGIDGVGGAAGAAAAAPAAAPASPSLSAFGMAMVFVLLTFGGWNEAAYISAELKDERRNMVKALVLSIIIITVLYLAVNWAYWRGLGMEGMAKSDAIASDLLKAVFGPIGATMISVMVAIAALTSMNATMIVGARTNFAVGRDWPLLSRLGQWDDGRGTPMAALVVQCVAALVLVAVGMLAGGGFKAMVEFTAPVFWLFFLLSGISLFVLRVREPDAVRPFRVPLYPVLPLIFCAVCAYMLWASLSYVYSQELGGLNAAWIGVGVLAVGAMLLLVMGKPQQTAS